MLPRTLRKSTPFSIFTALIYGIPFIVLAYYNSRGVVSSYPNDTLLSPYIDTIAAISWLNKTMGALLLIATAIYTQIVFVKHRIFKQNNQFTFILTLAVLSCSTFSATFSSWSISVLLIVHFFNLLFKIQKKVNISSVAFDTSVLIGLLCLLSINYIWLLAALILALFYNGRIRFKIIVLVLFGVFIPYYFLASLNYLLGLTYTINLLPFGLLPSKYIEHGYYTLTLFLGFLLVLAIGFNYFLKAVIVNKVSVKNHIMMLFILSVLLTISMLFNARSYADFLVAIFPIAPTLIGSYFLNAKRIYLMETVFFIWYISVIIYLIFGVSPPV